MINIAQKMTTTIGCDFLDRKSRWDFYGVKIIKQIIVDGEANQNLVDEFYDDDGKQNFEESVMLVRAQSCNHAYKIARQKAAKSDVPYPNAYGQQVTWKFIKAVDCFLILDKLVSGAEVYSCLHTTDINETAENFVDKWFTPTENKDSDK